ncbi:MAG: TonB-dependent receptor [Sphingomonas bacterium]|nr:TonB-dependent receptor [Sphingomonas bacterium]
MRMQMRAASFMAIATALATPGFAQDTAAQQATDTGPVTASQPSGGIADIVVTAQKRNENVQDVPIAISAFTAAALQERAVTDISGLSNISPNVTLDGGTPFSGSSAVLSAYIRGIGSNDFAFNIDPGVGVYLDGVYLARTVGANQDLLDVSRIEVLKGPQGTLFGRNTIGGAISIVTRDPGDEFAFNGDVTTGRFKLLQVRGSVDLPIMESLAASVTFGVKTRQGYLKRIPFPSTAPYVTDGFTSFPAAGYDTSDNEGGDDTWNTRVKLKWDNGGPLSVTLSGDYSKTDSNSIANTLIKSRQDVFAGWYNACINNTATSILTTPLPFIAALCAAPRSSVQGGVSGLSPLLGVNVDANPYNNRLPYDDRFVTGDIDRSYATGNSFSKMRVYGASGTVNFDLTDTVALKSITAYRELHWAAGVDLDSSPLEMLHTSFSLNQYQFSQELQLLGNMFDKSLNYVLGAYYFKEAGDLHDYVTFPAGLLQVDGPNDLKTKNYAFFGQVDWRLNDLLGFTLGGRYTHEDKFFEGGQADRNGQAYKLAGLPVSEASRQLLCASPGGACFPNPNQPLRYYVAGTQTKKFNNFAPKAGVQVHPSEDVMVYGSWSRGYKTGGWTTRLSNPLPFAPDFNEEKAETFEVGVKSQFLNRRLQVNAAAFTTRYDGIQLNFQQGVSPVVQNAGNARIKGFEVEIVAAPTDGLTINGSVGYVDSYYTDVLAAAQVPTSVDQIGVYPGATLPKTPKWKYNIGPRYEVSLGNGGSLIALADYTHTAPLKNDTEGSYLINRRATDIVNASITYREPNAHWDLTIGGTNLTDERYLVTGQFQAAGGQIYGTYSRPAEWYARLAVKF